MKSLIVRFANYKLPRAPVFLDPLEIGTDIIHVLVHSEYGGRGMTATDSDTRLVAKNSRQPDLELRNEKYKRSGSVASRPTMT